MLDNFSPQGLVGDPNPPPDHIQLVMNRLKDAQARVLVEALSDLIPPWCSGIQETFWLTDAGRYIATSLWALHGHEALTFKGALYTVFGPHARRTPVLEDILRKRLVPYPNPSSIRRTLSLEKNDPDWAQRMASGELKKINLHFYFLRSACLALRDELRSQASMGIVESEETNV